MNTSPAPAADLQAVLQRHFDTATFRPGQREALAAVLAGEDTLVVVPTGTGKSLIYQLAALVLSGTVLVLSALIQLMRHQIEDLRARDFPHVAMPHSQVPEAEQRCAPTR